MGAEFAPTHAALHTNTRCGYVVSPAAAQLIQALTNPPSPLPPPYSHNPTVAHRFPIPGDRTASLGTHFLSRGQRASSWGWGRGDAWGRNLRGGFIKKEGKKVAVKRQRREEKVEGRSVGVTYHIVYHIQKSQGWLSSWRLSQVWKVNVCVLMEMRRWWHRLHYSHCMKASLGWPLNVNWIYSCKCY